MLLDRELIDSLEYKGCGWFRDKRISKGKRAPVIHGPELLELFKKFLKDKDDQ